MRMPSIASKMPRSRNIWIRFVDNSNSVGLGQRGSPPRLGAKRAIRLSARSTSAAHEPGTVDQNGFIETFKVDAEPKCKLMISARAIQRHTVVRAEASSSLRIQPDLHAWR